MPRMFAFVLSSCCQITGMCSTFDLSQLNTRCGPMWRKAGGRERGRGYRDPGNDIRRSIAEDDLRRNPRWQDHPASSACETCEASTLTACNVRYGSRRFRSRHAQKEVTRNTVAKKRAVRETRIPTTPLLTYLCTQTTGATSARCSSEA